MPRRAALRVPLLLSGLALLVCGSTVPAAARDVVLDADGSVLAIPSAPATRMLAPVRGCRSLLDAGNGDCAVVRTARGDLVVTVEPGPRIDDVLVSRPWTVRVYRPAPGVADGWQIALETRPVDGAAGPLYAIVTAKAADVTRDGRDELIIGYRSEGTGMVLDVDIVGTDHGGTPVVLAHEQLYKGSVVFRHGRLIAYVPVYERADANCCPTWIERDVLRFRDGEPRFSHGRRVRSRAADVPPSEIG